MASSPKKLCTSAAGLAKKDCVKECVEGTIATMASNTEEASSKDEARLVLEKANDRTTKKAVVDSEDEGKAGSCDEVDADDSDDDDDEDDDDDDDDDLDSDDDEDDNESSGGNESDSEGGEESHGEGSDSKRPRQKARRLRSKERAARAGRVANGSGRSGRVPPREIQVEFEARAPKRQDYFGVLNLLKPMLTPTTSFPFPDLTNAILEQRFLGSVITKAYEPGDDDSTTDEEDNGARVVIDGSSQRTTTASAPDATRVHPDAEDREAMGNHRIRNNSETRSRTTSSSSGSAAAASAGGSLVLGLGTILRILRGTKVSDNLVKHVVSRCEQSDPSKAAALSAFLADDSKCLGFLISERIINMPPQISSPLYETLLTELRRASGDLKMASFKFTHFMLISRILATPDNNVRIFANAEEELFMAESQLVCQLYDQLHSNGNGSNSSSSNSSNSSNRPSHEQVILEPQQKHSHSTDDMVEQRLLMIFEASKLSLVRAKIDACFPAS